MGSEPGQQSNGGLTARRARRRLWRKDVTNDFRRCPFCRSSRFAEFSGRAAAVCTGCGALERQRALARLACASFEDGRGRRCLEAGPLNRAVFGEHLRRRGWDYVAIDRFRTGNPHDPRNVAFVDCETSLTDLSMFAAGSFDLFLMQHVLEEIEGFELALDEIVRVLGAQGRALMEIPFDPDQTRSAPMAPDRFGNVWRFGADLVERVAARFATVEVIELAEASYTGRLLVCTASPAVG